MIYVKPPPLKRGIEGDLFKKIPPNLPFSKGGAIYPTMPLIVVNLPN
jgi:hypothetical protein